VGRRWIAECRSGSLPRETAVVRPEGEPVSRRRTRRSSAFEGDHTPLRALFEHSRDGIYLHDLEGRFLDANPAALEMLGYAAETWSSPTWCSRG
jgi:PAS domain-containing protein